MDTENNRNNVNEMVVGVIIAVNTVGSNNNGGEAWYGVDMAVEGNGGYGERMDTEKNGNSVKE